MSAFPHLRQPAARCAPLVLALTLAALAPSAFAQGFDAVRLFGAAPGKDGGIAGAALIAGTAYQGSDERRTMLLPLINYQWANGWFAGVTNGVGYNFSGRPDLQYGLRLTADFGRKQSRSSALRGMGDVDASAEFGGFLNHAIGRTIFLTSSVRYGSGQNNQGLVVDLGASHSTEIAPGWRLGTGLATTLANADHLQSYFGVTATQAAARRYAAFKPKAGLRDARVNLSIGYQVDNRTSITTAISASTLLGDAKNSPLARKSSTVSGVLAAAYAF